MSFLISDALAAAAPAGNVAQQDGGGMGFTLMLVLFIVVFYFLLLRPQTKRAKEHRKLVDQLTKGDEVIISGGIYGKIVDIADNIVKLAITDNVEIKVQKSSVIATVPKGTLKQI